MIKVIEGSAAAMFVAQLENAAGGPDLRDVRGLLASMFEDRKLLFADLLGWRLSIVADRFEIDEFDNGDAVYLIAEDASGRHEGSMRLLPSIRPHLLGSLFRSLCADGVPVGPQIFEITRLCLPQRLGAERRLAVRNRLISAMVDYSLARDISLLTGVVEDRFRKEILAMGWRAETLGPATAMEGGVLGAFAVRIEADTAERLRWTGIYSEASLAVGMAA